jgi:uncharacterized membrane protein
MTKKEFLDELKKGLLGLPEEDITRSIEFYSEMIDDRIEDGKTEEEAVADIGTVKYAVSQILAEISITKLIKEKVKKKRKIGALEIVLLVLGSPIWLSLLIVAFAVVLSVYVVIWSVIVSLWAVFASLAGVAVGGIFAGVIFVCNSNLLIGIAMFGASLVLAGLSIVSFFGCKAATKGILILTKKMALGIKNCFVKKEEV